VLTSVFVATGLRLRWLTTVVFAVSVSLVAVGVGRGAGRGAGVRVEPVRLLPRDVR